MSDFAVLDARRGPAAVSRAAGGITFAVAVVVGLLAGTGWLYALRGTGWLRSGPNIADSLPLLQLAGFDAQPLLRVAVAWLLVGLLTGVALIRCSPSHRAVLAGALGLVLLLLASQVSYALARNLRLSDVVLHRSPGPGPWVEALLFAVGCALPRRAIAGAQRRRVGPVRGAGAIGGQQPGLGGGEDRHAAEHHRDRGQVGEDRSGIRA